MLKYKPPAFSKKMLGLVRYHYGVIDMANLLPQII